MSPPDEISPLKAKSPTFSANYVLYQVVRHLMLDHPEDAEADEHQQIESAAMPPHHGDQRRHARHIERRTPPAFSRPGFHCHMREAAAERTAAAQPWHHALEEDERRQEEDRTGPVERFHRLP